MAAEPAAVVNVLQGERAWWNVRIFECRRVQEANGVVARWLDSNRGLACPGTGWWTLSVPPSTVCAQGVFVTV